MSWLPDFLNLVLRSLKTVRKRIFGTKVSVQRKLQCLRRNVSEYVQIITIEVKIKILQKRCAKQHHQQFTSHLGLK